jgi:hypothetical protein
VEDPRNNFSVQPGIGRVNANGPIAAGRQAHELRDGLMRIELAWWRVVAWGGRMRLSGLAIQDAGDECLHLRRAVRRDAEFVKDVQEPRDDLFGLE